MVDMVKDWTFNTLEIYLSAKISALHNLVDLRQQDTEKALDAALEAMNRRLEGMNEFRQTLSDQRLADEKARSEVQANLVTREIYGLEHNLLKTSVDKNAEHINEMEKKLFALSELKVDKREGLSSKYMYSAILFAALSFVGSAIGIFLNVANHH